MTKGMARPAGRPLGCRRGREVGDGGGGGGGGGGGEKKSERKKRRTIQLICPFERALGLGWPLTVSTESGQVTVRFRASRNSGLKSRTQAVGDEMNWGWGCRFVQYTASIHLHRYLHFMAALLQLPTLLDAHSRSNSPPSHSNDRNAPFSGNGANTNVNLNPDGLDLMRLSQAQDRQLEEDQGTRLSSNRSTSASD